MDTLKNITLIPESVLKKKLVAMAADGCNTMQGRHKGALTLMKQRCPHIVKVVCISHTWNLIVSILDSSSFFSRISQAVRDVSVYFHGSPKRIACLHDAQRELNLDKLTPIKVIETRWMPIFKAMQNLMRMLPAVLKVLKSNMEINRESNAATLYNELTQATVLMGMYAMYPLIAQLESVTKVCSIYR